MLCDGCGEDFGDEAIKTDSGLILCSECVARKKEEEGGDKE
jgi:formylmethanofuran dehydrogenase subunit E